MIVYPNAKINIGLNVIQKRKDGYHNIESILYPIPLADILEIIPSETFEFTQSGIQVESSSNNNLVVQAYQAMRDTAKIQKVKIHLHKNIPTGAGLGGGSSDAAFTLVALNKMFGNKQTPEQLHKMAAKLGSDCPFFINNVPSIASGRGELLKPATVHIENYYLIIVKPQCHISTAEAYANIVPCKADQNLEASIKESPSNWKKTIKNAFEKPVIALYPEIGNIKKTLYEAGATYAAMSGSGSSVFGLFKSAPTSLENHFEDCFFFKAQL